METRKSLFKTECIRTTVLYPGLYHTLADLEYATTGWVHRYNNRRLHCTVGVLTPVEFETLHYQTLTREPETTK